MDPKGNMAAANVIAENLLNQIDPEGNQQRLLKEIVGHSRKDAKACKKKNGTKAKTTKGWKLCVEWRDGTTSWVPLATLKEQMPVEVAEYAVAHSLLEEPAFAWWAHQDALKRRDVIIAAVNKRYWKTTHKFGIRIPHSVAQAHAIDRAEGNTKWANAIKKEMKNIMIAFEMRGKGAPIPPGHQQVIKKCHMVFDVKMDNFKYKARLVAGGHMTETPSHLTYASVVSRESVRIALTMAALHDLQVKAGDIQNASYLTAPPDEKMAIICGPEFGEYEGQTAVIKRALYGLKSSAHAYRLHLADYMKHIGYQPCLADNDVWYKPETKPNGMEYYAYVLIYVDDILVIHHDAMAALLEINKFFTIKKESMGDPDIYLGCKLRKYTLPNGQEAWLQSPSKYIEEVVRKAGEYFEQEYNLSFPKKVTSPFSPDYRPELDITNH
jgi:Reverse transcriptase (RNA-dependent DNA polymerase)